MSAGIFSPLHHSQQDLTCTLPGAAVGEGALVDHELAASGFIGFRMLQIEIYLF